jgi:hypothetical protein
MDLEPHLDPIPTVREFHPRSGTVAAHLLSDHVRRRNGLLLGAPDARTTFLVRLPVSRHDSEERQGPAPEEGPLHHEPTIAVCRPGSVEDHVTATHRPGGAADPDRPSVPGIAPMQDESQPDAVCWPVKDQTRSDAAPAANGHVRIGLCHRSLKHKEPHHHQDNNSSSHWPSLRSGTVTGPRSGRPRRPGGVPRARPPARRAVLAPVARRRDGLLGARCPRVRFTS